MVSVGIHILWSELPVSAEPTDPDTQTINAATTGTKKPVEVTTKASAEVTTNIKNEVAAKDSTEASKLKGEVSMKEPRNPFGAAALDDPASLRTNEKGTVLHSLGASTKSLANFVFDLRGFDWSKEGANAVADFHIDPKNAAAKEYLFRKKCDEQEIQKAALIMQMALYMDLNPKKASQALVALEKLIGTEQAVDTYCAVSRLSGDDIDLDAQAPVLDFSQKRSMVGSILEKAATNDAVLSDVAKRLSKYNHRSKLMQATAKVVYSSLGIATFAPTLVAPIAEATLLSFMMATGGPEQDKLLKEVYLGKIMQSRCSLLNEKAHLVTESIDLAKLTNNKRLLACSRALLKDLTDEKTSQEVLKP